MGRRKRKIMKPWCWYCNREFEDEKVLIYHQKSKHYRCQICRKKLYSAVGLSVHCMQVHKDTISTVPNALPHRSNFEIEIFGMDGIPQEDMDERMRMINDVNKSKNGKSLNNQSNEISYIPTPNLYNSYESINFVNNEINIIPPPPPPPPSSSHILSNNLDQPPPPPPPIIEDGNKIKNPNLLSLDQFKRFNVCLTSSSIIIHPEYEISLEEYRLSQKEYRTCLPIPGQIGFNYGSNGVRPPTTVAYGYLRMAPNVVPPPSNVYAKPR